jgi:hypothetical protein
MKGDEKMENKQGWKLCEVCAKCKNKKKCGYKFSVKIKSFHCARFTPSKEEEVKGNGKKGK